MSEYKYPAFDGSQNCASVGTVLFFPEDNLGRCSLVNDEIKAALIQVCSNCSFLTECATYAINHEEYGFWGGMSAKERRDYRRKYGIVLERIEYERE